MSISYRLTDGIFGTMKPHAIHKATSMLPLPESVEFQRLDWNGEAFAEDFRLNIEAHFVILRCLFSSRQRINSVINILYVAWNVSPKTIIFTPEMSVIRYC